MTQRSPKDQTSNFELPLSVGLSCFVIPSYSGFSDLPFTSFIAGAALRPLPSAVGLPIAFISPGSGELIIIMLALILLFGAKDAPRILRTIQTFLDKMQRSAADFRYKMMYGDLHQNTTDESPYDVEEAYPKDEDSAFHEGEEPPQESGVGGQESEGGDQSPETTKPKANHSEPETKNSEPTQ